MGKIKNINLFCVLLLCLVNVFCVIADTSCSQFSSSDSENYWFVVAIRILFIDS